MGGLNVYSYVDNDPVRLVDPSGMGPRWDSFKKKVKKKTKGACRAVKKGAKKVWKVLKELPSRTKGVPTSPVPADLAPDVAQCLMGDAKRRHVLKDHPEDPFKDGCPTCKRLTPKSGIP
jgi:hypothetical protein